jgi:cell division protein FtsQ
MNRRKRIQRRGLIRRLLAGDGNRRVRPATASDKPARPPLSWRLVARGLLQLARLSALAAAVVAMGIAGYYGYHRVVTSTYFLVERIEISGIEHTPRQQLQQRLAPVRGRAIFFVDTRQLATRLASHPWIESASVRRVLPDTLSLEIVEQRPAAAVLLGAIYLVNAQAELFKRATLAEAEGLPLITGIDREEYRRHPAKAGERIRRALAVIDQYREQNRPPLSEVNIGSRQEITLFLRDRGVALRFGPHFDAKRLHKLDAAKAALGGDASRARVFYLDNEVHPERVIVRLSQDEIAASAH